MTKQCRFQLVAAGSSSFQGKITPQSNVHQSKSKYGGTIRKTRLHSTHLQRATRITRHQQDLLKKTRNKKKNWWKMRIYHLRWMISSLRCCLKATRCASETVRVCRMIWCNVLGFEPILWSVQTHALWKHGELCCAFVTLSNQQPEVKSFSATIWT